MANLDAEAIEEPETDASLSSAEGDVPKRTVRLWLLLVAHVFLGLVFCIWSGVVGMLPFVLDLLLLVAVFGVVLAQSSLLGFWAVFSPAKWWLRLPGLIVGIIYLEFLLGIGTPNDAFNWLATMAACGITAVFGLIHWRYAELRRFSQQDHPTGQEGIKFSIQGLMLFTFVVAVVIVGVNQLRNNASVGPSFLAISFWSLCFVVVGLTGVWAALGLARPALRSVVVLLVSAALGVLFVYAIKQDDNETDILLIVSIMLLHAGVLIASLLIVRSCGYRLVRKLASEAKPLD